MVSSRRPGRLSSLRGGSRSRALLGLLVVSTLLAGCGDKPAADPNAVTLTFWHSFVSSTRPALDELIQRFETDHPGIRINAQYIPTGDALVQKLVAAIRSETAPDIAWIHADFMDKLVQADAIYRMDRFVEGPNGLTHDELNDFFPGLLQTASWRDTLYSIPMEATSLGLVYNRDLFRAAGLDPRRPPATWDELRDYAMRLTRDTNDDGKTDQWGLYVPVFPASGSLNIWMVLQWTPFLWQSGGNIIDEAQTEVQYNSAAGIEALTYWRDLYAAQKLDGFSIAHDVGFASGRLAMVFDGPWSLPRYREMQDVDWAIAPLPAGPAGPATYLAGEQLAIFKQSEHPDEAWTFIKWVVQPEIQAMFSQSSGYLPVRKSTLEIESYREHLAADSALAVFVDQMKVARTRRPIDFHHVELNRHIAEAIERTIVGDVDPKTALGEAAEKSNSLLATRAHE